MSFTVFTNSEHVDVVELVALSAVQSSEELGRYEEDCTLSLLCDILLPSTKFIFSGKKTAESVYLPAINN